MFGSHSTSIPDDGTRDMLYNFRVLFHNDMNAREDFVAFSCSKIFKSHKEHFPLKETVENDIPTGSALPEGCHQVLEPLQ